MLGSMLVTGSIERGAKSPGGSIMDALSWLL